MIESQEKDDGLYRYMSAELCLKVLRGGKLRLSSPLKFNDPFDVVRNISSLCNHSIIDELIKYITENYINKDKKPENKTGLGYKIYEMLTKCNPKDINKEYEFKRKFDKLQTFQWNRILDRIRIICFSTQKYNIPLWYHYADKYKGVMISFSTDIHLFDTEKYRKKSENKDKDKDEVEDLPSINDKKFLKVKYIDKDKNIFLTKELFLKLWLETDEQLEKNLQDLLIIKDNDWSYEKEKRIISILHPKLFDGELYTEFDLAKEAVNGIYFGPEIEINVKNEILALARIRYKNAEFFQAQATHHLEYVKID